MAADNDSPPHYKSQRPDGCRDRCAWQKMTLESSLAIGAYIPQCDDSDEDGRFLPVQVSPLLDLPSHIVTDGITVGHNVCSPILHYEQCLLCGSAGVGLNRPELVCRHQVWEANLGPPASGTGPQLQLDHQWPRLHYYDTSAHCYNTLYTNIDC